MAFQSALAEIAAEVDGRLAAVVASLEAPSRLKAAMGHALLAGGKRLRPFLVIECAGLFGIARGAAMPTALALECLHTYSLIHDDLPAMDDDDLRRGQPTVHVAFDEATAVLAGDALLTLAFGIVADPATHPDPAVRAALAGDLAAAAGAAGMVGGQMLDLAFETEAPDAEAIRAMQAMKTGALFRFACVAGATLAAAGTRERAALASFADGFGAAFQITDDLIDESASEAEAGKRTGKDAARGKATLVAVRGAEAARCEAHRLIEGAVAALEPFGAAADNLAELCRFLIDRRS